MWRAVALLLAFTSLSTAATRQQLEQGTSPQARYFGFKVFRATVETKENLDALKLLQSTSEYVDFWNDPLNYGADRTVDVMVPQGKITELTNFFNLMNIQSEELISDVQHAIDAENPQISEVEQAYLELRQGHSYTFTKYMPFDSFESYLNYLKATYPQLVTVQSVGRSVEGRAIYGVKISSGGSKPAIFVEGGVHAREWISPATVMNLIRSLVEDYNKHPNLVDDVDWYIMPMVNPDGYMYSYKSNRMWRKNRRIFDSSSSSYPTYPIFGQGRKCDGVDLNRNFPYKWNSHLQSNNKCRETYRGTSAQSEPETQAVINFFNQHRSAIKMYLSFHSYGNYWLLTCKKSQDPTCYQRQETMARKALQKMGERYKVGHPVEILYDATGVSDSWAESQGIKYSFTIELPGKNRGFLLPASNIRPVAASILNGVKVLAGEVAKM